MTSRNKLVKRSTSQRALQRDYSPKSPFASASSTPSFRRPATSHQRSEHLRIQNIQKDLGNRNQRAKSPSRQAEGLQDLGGVGLAKDPKSRPWLPFFRSKVTTVRQDISPRGSASKFRGFPGTVRRVVLSSQSLPTLVMGSSIEKPAMEQMTDNPPSDTPNSILNTDLDPPPNHRDGAEASPESKSRTSFSMSGLLPSSSPSWKIGRGGSLKRRKGRESSNVGRRVASAPGQPFIQHGSREGNHQTPHNVGLAQTSVDEVQSSSLPSNKPSPAMRGDRLKASLINHHPSTQNASSSSTTHPSSSPIVNSTLLHPSQTRFRTSRVPSDHDSTVFESDNEQSRVFSADGDDADYRSETVYDSIRTEATGSSHSGARGPNIENFFGDRQSPDLVKQNLTRLQEQLAGVSLKHSADPENYIAEEEEGFHTPIPPVQPGDRMLSSEPASVPRPELSYPPSSPSLAVHKAGYSEKELVIGDGDISENWSIDEDEHSSTVAGLGCPGLKDEHPQDLGSFGLQAAPPNPRQLSDTSERPKSNIFEWSERQAVEKDPQDGSSPRPKTAHAQQIVERGGRSAGRRGTSGYHLRSQSVPLPPDNSSHRVNNSSKLDSWILGGKGVSEDWDGDFEFDEPAESGPQGSREDVNTENSSDALGVVVPRSILERQASVHGQFGQVKELTLLVEELRRLQRSAIAHGILNGQSSELWKEAEGIIDLATLDEEETSFFSSHSPHSTSFDFDAFDEDFVGLPHPPKSSVSPGEDIQQLQDSGTASQLPSHSSPSGSKLSTPQSRPRKESVGKAKHVLENIHQHRSSLDPPLVSSKAASKKLPFDTTSLRDLVTRAGVVTRALKEIIRRIEDPGYAPNTPERRPDTPPDPPFSQIFHQSASPTLSKRSPRALKKKSSGSFMGASMTSNDNELNGHIKMMTVV